MKKICSLLLVMFLPLFAGDEYRELLKNYPGLFEPKGDHRLGEIEIVTDAQKTEEIQQKQYERLLSLGISPDRASKWTKVGEIARDRYSLWVRDAVIFPSGAVGLYNRLISEAALRGNIGAAILPVFPNKDIGLVVEFRHATRAFELAIPRGGGDGSESSLMTAKRELLEEAGLEADKWQLLGHMAPETGTLQSTVPVFLAEQLRESRKAPEESEAIEYLIRLPLCRVNEALKAGFIELDVKGVKRKVYVRDSYLVYALYLYSIQ